MWRVNTSYGVLASFYHYCNGVMVRFSAVMVESEAAIKFENRRSYVVVSVTLVLNSIGVGGRAK